MKPDSPTSARFGPPAATGLLGLVTLWFVTQSGLLPQAPESAEAFVGIWLVLFRHLWPVALLWLGAAGWGCLLRRWLFNREDVSLSAQAGLGLAAVLLGHWLLAWAGVAQSVIPPLCLLAGGVTAGVLRLRESVRGRVEDRSRHGSPTTWSLLLCVPGAVLLLVAACCPPGTLWRVEAYAYDVTSYHLQLPREWAALGRMAGLEHNVYSFLPSLIESGYLLLRTWGQAQTNAVYSSQLFHGSLALLAAAALGQTVAGRAGRAAGVGVAGLFLAVPWVLITGSLAYNEMGVLAFGAVAMKLLFGAAPMTRRRAGAIGALAGAATLCKLTAGVMLAVPIGLILLLSLSRSPGQSEARTGHPVRFAAIAALAGCLVLSPYLVRNYFATGNPVFPFAAETLGAGHWDEARVQRWDTAHGLSPKHEGKAEALGRQWLFNTGYGAIGGRPTPRETQNVARFDYEGGVPALWIMVLISSLLVMTNRDTRRIGSALLLMLAVQVGFWLFFTHLQSRFLLPTLLPACLMVGLGYERLQQRTRAKSPTVAPLIGSALVLTLAVMSYTTLTAQTRTVPDPVTGRPVPLPVWAVIGSPMDSTDHPINRLPDASKTLLVADNMGLLYLDRPIVYASAFDEAPLGRAIRAAGGDPEQVNAILRGDGVSHVWVHWAELHRLHSTYGHDPDVTHETINALIATGWTPVESVGHTATLFRLPG